MMENYSDLDWLKINTSGAEIHIQAIAEKMWDLYNSNQPELLQDGEWHIPFGDGISPDDITIIGKEKGKEMYFVTPHDEVKIQIATARCARTSYLNFEGKNYYSEDIKLHDRLLDSGHMSPFEHCARAMNDEEYECNFVMSTESEYENSSSEYKTVKGVSGNFTGGWLQYRKMIEGENKI